MSKTESEREREMANMTQAEAREIVAENGCRICGWRTPGEIVSVEGDLWCLHCAEEHAGMRPGIQAKVAGLTWVTLA